MNRWSTWCVLVLGVTGACTRVAPHGSRSGPEIVVVPTLGTDHQFNLDYSVAHLTNLLDAIAPDGVIVDDYSAWLDRGCLWNLDFPENHVAMSWASAHGAALVGTSLNPSDSAFERARRSTLEFTTEYPDVESVRNGAIVRLDQATARIAAEYSFAEPAPTLSYLLEGGFARKAADWTLAQRAAIERYASGLVDSIAVRLKARSDIDRWVVFLNWPGALFVMSRLDASIGRSLPIESFARALDTTRLASTDPALLAWMASGLLDEWYGMWAPQVFDGARIAEILQVLELLDPNAAMTLFLSARWSMRNRDFEAARTTLEALVESVGDERVPFPVVGKWIRPPWSSIRQKALLNLAFLHDLQGRRSDALTIYDALLENGANLSLEARAAGYVYDDIEWVVRSYRESPYVGDASEALRHFRLQTGVPSCLSDREAGP